MHPAVIVARKLGARPRAVAEVELATSQPGAYVAKFAKRLAERRITKPTKQLPWIALIDALTGDRLAVEFDHRTFPEDVVDAIETLRSLPKSRSRWRWARDVDDGTSTERFLAAVVHHAKIPLALIDIGSDSFVIVASKDTKLGLQRIAPQPLEPAQCVTPYLTDAKLIATGELHQRVEQGWQRVFPARTCKHCTSPRRSDQFSDGAWRV